MQHERASKEGRRAYLEVEDDGPDETEGQLGVAVHDVLAPDVDQLDLLVAEKAEGGLDVLYGVEAHPAPLARLKRKKNIWNKI